MSTAKVVVVISSSLEPGLVQQIAAVDPRVEVLYDPELLAVPRYVSDHVGRYSPLTAARARQWHAMMRRAEVSFDFDRREPALADVNFPNLRWIQASSAGVGQVLPRFALDLNRVKITTAAGIHSEPLSEFVIAGLLYFIKGIPQLRRWQRDHEWIRYTSENLSGKRILVVGLGHVGQLTSAKLSALGAHVVGAVRPGGTAGAPGVSEVVEFGTIVDVIPNIDAVVLACPLTDETDGLISQAVFEAMRPGTLLVNIARGQVIDEAAMTAALRSGQLRGAALDVATTEPLPANSSLWDMESVLISPHSASTVTAENQLLTDLFCDNLRRWLAGEPLRNLYRPDLGY